MCVCLCAPCREDRHGQVQVGPGPGCRGDGAQLPAHVGGAVHAVWTDAHAQWRVGALAFPYTPTECVESVFIHVQ